MKITSELAPLSPCPCSLCCVYKTTLNMINTNITKRMCSTSLFIYEVLSPSTAALREIRRCRKFIKLLNTQLSYQTLVRKNNRVSILVGSKYATSSPRPYLCSCSRCFVFKTTFNTMPASLTKRNCSTLFLITRSPSNLLFLNVSTSSGLKRTLSQSLCTLARLWRTRRLIPSASCTAACPRS